MTHCACASVRIELELKSAKVMSAVRPHAWSHAAPPRAVLTPANSIANILLREGERIKSRNERDQKSLCHDDGEYVPEQFLFKLKIPVYAWVCMRMQFTE